MNAAEFNYDFWTLPVGYSKTHFAFGGFALISGH